jgi:hypothetical protein
MVCAKCQKTLKQTELATPAVKRKNEMYYGSPAGDKTKATRGGGISKVGFNVFLNRYLFRNADQILIEQTTKQNRQKSLRSLLQFLRDVQNQNRAGKKILPALRI